MSETEVRVIRRRGGAKNPPPKLDLNEVKDVSKTRMELPSLMASKEAQMKPKNETVDPPPQETAKTDPPLNHDLRTPSLPQFLESVRDTGNLPLNDMFRDLTEQLKVKMPNAKNTDIAALVGIRPQSCSQYKTGSDGRRPPWNILLQMMTMLNLELVINQEGWCFRKRRRSKK